MKTALISVLLAFSTVFSTAQAQIPLLQDLASNFEEIQLDPKLGLPGVEQGYITITRTELHVTLLARDGNGLLRPVRSILLPIVNRTESCGSQIVTAQLDERNVDGDLKTLVLMDHRARRCRDVRAHVTEVTYKTLGFSPMGRHETSSYFGGEALQPILE